MENNGGFSDEFQQFEIEALVHGIDRQDLNGAAQNLCDYLVAAFNFRGKTEPQRLVFLEELYDVLSAMMPELFGKAAVAHIAEYNAMQDRIISAAELSIRTQPEPTDDDIWNWKS